MFCIGEVSEEKKKLVDVTKECIEIGLKHVKPWALLGDMGHAIHEHALENGYTVVREIEVMVLDCSSTKILCKLCLRARNRYGYGSWNDVYNRTYGKYGN